MTKNEFLNSLKRQLSGLPESEIKEVISDYTEHFDIGLESGRSEDDLAKSLGDPRNIGRQIKASSKIKKAEKNASVGNIIRAVFATAGLGFLNLVFILGPFIGIVMCLFGLFATGIGISAFGVVSTIMSFIAIFSPAVLEHFFVSSVSPFSVLFFGISMSSFGVLFTIGCGYLAKWLYIMTVRYLKFNLQIILGEKD